MQRFSMIAGFFSVTGGVFLIWMAYGFASMVDPDLQGAARRAEIMRRLTTNGGGAIGLGILLVCSGLWLAFRGPKPSS